MGNLVSVIIPTYKRSDYLLQAINSVLKQTYSPIEIIVVDDNGMGSENQVATQKKLQSLIDEGRIVYIPHQTNKNGSAARNTGWKASTGQYILFLDDDDELLPLCIEQHMHRLCQVPKEVGACYCRAISKRVNSIGQCIMHASESTKEGKPVYDYLLNTGKASFGTSCILFRRDVINQLNGWNESYIRHQDLELLTRFFRDYEIVCIAEDPQIVYDLSKDRGNMLDPQKDYEVKTKYLSEFEPDFLKWGIKDEVMHHFWKNCAATALFASDYQTFRKAYSNGERYSPFSVQEKTWLLKYFVSGKINAFKQMGGGNFAYQIIIPHYGIPQLLQRCLFSIPQRDDLGIIVVDDSSPDAFDLLLMCPALFRSDVNFVKRETCGGGGAARNDGLRLAQSKWILFADADDYFNPCLSVILDEYRDNSNDLIVFNANSVDSETYISSNRSLYLNKIISKWEKDKERIGNILRYRIGTPWGKLIRRSVIEDNHLWFDEIPKNNDYHFCYMLGSKVHSVSADKRALYCLTYRPQSITYTKESDEAFLLRIKLYAECSRYFKEHNLPAEENAHFGLLLHRWREKDIFDKGIEILRKTGFCNKTILYGLTCAFFANFKVCLRNRIKYRIRKA